MFVVSSSVYSDRISRDNLPGCRSHHPASLLGQDRTSQGTQAAQAEGQAYNEIFHLNKTCQVRPSQPSLHIEEQPGTTSTASQQALPGNRGRGRLCSRRLMLLVGRLQMLDNVRVNTDMGNKV